MRSTSTSVRFALSLNYYIYPTEIYDSKPKSTVKPEFINPLNLHGIVMVMLIKTWRLYCADSKFIGFGLTITSTTKK